MFLQAAVNLNRQNDGATDDEQYGFVYVSSTVLRPHKFDKASHLCLMCLAHRASYIGPMCPGLLNPSIRAGVD